MRTSQDLKLLIHRQNWRRSGRPQFSLAGLLLAVWLVAAVLGTVVWSTDNRNEWRLRALAAVPKGGSLVRVTCANLSRDGKLLVTGDAYVPQPTMSLLHGRVTLWDATKARPIQSFKLSALPDAVAISADGQRVFAVSAHEAVCWDANGAAPVKTLCAPRKSYFSASVISADATTLAVSEEGAITVVHLVHQHQRVILSGNRHHGLRLSRDGKYLAALRGGRHPDLTVWDLESGKVRWTTRGCAIDPRAMAFSPDGKKLAIAGGDGTIKLWDVATKDERPKLAWDGGWSEHLVFCPNGKSLVSARTTAMAKHIASGITSVGTEIKQWDASNGRKLASLSMSSGEMLGALAFTPNGRILAVTANDGTVYFWDVPEGSVIHATLLFGTLAVWATAWLGFRIKRRIRRPNPLQSSEV